MSSDHEQPAAKRQRLDTEPSSSSSSLIPTFFNEQATGLFGVLANSISKRPANEEEVGITQYVSPDVQAFSGIIKHRFTDFLVNEVGLDGQVVRLKDIDGPGGKRNKKEGQEATQQAGNAEGAAETVATAEETTKPQECAPAEGAAAAAAPTEEEKPSDAPAAEEVPSLWTPEVEAQVTPLFENNADKLVEFKAFVEAGPAAQQQQNNKADKRTFVTQPIPDKSLRGKFHQTLREAFSSKLVSAHKEGEAGAEGGAAAAPAIEVSWAQTATGGRNRKRGGASTRGERGDRPDFATLPSYIHFTLHKTNKESHDAMSILSRYFNLPHNAASRDLGAAGTKDKRAVTVQRISLRRGKTMTVEDVWRAARTGTIARGGGGGGRGGRGGGRGGGGGGWVDRMMRIGDVEYADKALELGMLKGNRFMITLRDVETPSIATLHASVSSIRERGFINYYGMQRFGTAPIPTHAVGLALLRGEWALAAELLLAEREGEQQDMILPRILWREGKVAEAARAMPRRAVAERAVLEAYSRGNKTDHLGAISTIPKNLRLMYVHAWQSYIWNRLVSERIKLFGPSTPVEGDLVYAEQVADEETVATGEDGDHPAAVNEEAPNVDAATPADAAAANLQLAHYLATSSVPKVHALTAEDIQSGKYTINDVVLPMPGFAVQYPAGQLGEVYRRVIREDGINPDDMWRKQKEYSLGGTYRKILHMPQDVSYRLLVSTSPNEDLAQTDEDRLLGRPAPQAREYREEDGPLKEGESLALQIELTLGSSTYATMALREVLKSRTSAATQKGLTQAMEARLKAAEPAEGAAASEAMQTEAAPAAVTEA
ncbi:hypothetical protein JCM10908_001762 [Rhodotorula pacifica]|uniref:pseudouridine synthase PUS7 n=1 Tax=Rhodotorula pacifica TaxID=1495444 RepID=UPI00316DB5A7